MKTKSLVPRPYLARISLPVTRDTESNPHWGWFWVWAETRRQKEPCIALTLFPELLTPVFVTVVRVL